MNSSCSHACSLARLFETFRRAFNAPTANDLRRASRLETKHGRDLHNGQIEIK